MPREAEAVAGPWLEVARAAAVAAAGRAAKPRAPGQFKLDSVGMFRGSEVMTCACCVVRSFPYKKLPKLLRNTPMLRKWSLKNRLREMTPAEDVFMTKYVPHAVERKIASTLSSPDGGLFVLWGPKGAGRTGYVRHVAISRMEHHKKVRLHSAD